MKVKLNHVRFVTAALFTPSLNMNPSVPAKRARVDAELTQDSFVKVENLWFDDGSIVLQASFGPRHPRSGEPMQGYRVHRSVLALHSKTFFDMFAYSQPEGELLVEGCFVVVMQDCASDLEHLLRALYDPGCVITGPRTINWISHVFPSDICLIISTDIRYGILPCYWNAEIR